jgi:hypothetical protein
MTVMLCPMFVRPLMAVLQIVTVVEIVVAVVIPEKAAMTVAMSAPLSQVAPRAQGDPAPKQNERDAGDCIHHAAKTGRELDSGEPNRQSDDQGCQDVPDTSLRGGEGGLPPRPGPLPSYQGDRRPVIRDCRVQHADDRDGYDKEEPGGCD